MKYIYIIVVLLFFKLQTANAQDAKYIYSKIVNSTVTIETESGIGSGFFIDNNIIVTNYHVVKGDSEIYCYLNNSNVKYKISKYFEVDEKSDLILLYSEELNMPSIKMASSHNISPGEKIYVIGSPKGLPATISDGIISGLRDFDGEQLIQISAPISPGSSGGPVVNSNGELVGIAVGQFKEGQNLNFAIPKIKLEKLLSKVKTSSNNQNDQDQDGVIDSMDKCPTVKGTVANQGCPEVSNDILKKLNDYTKTIYFNYEKSSFIHATIPVLQAIAAILKEYPDSKMLIDGHCDAYEFDVDSKLSIERAKAVKSFFIQNGISPDRLLIKDSGKSVPLDSNKTQEGRAKNRRVIISLIRE